MKETYGSFIDETSPDILEKQLSIASISMPCYKRKK
jgi:hypothetical protein